MAESLTRMLIAGPEVSLSGSPTVSPITAATCFSLWKTSSFPKVILDCSSALFDLRVSSNFFESLLQALNSAMHSSTS